MTILVTGATGRVGRHIVDQLARKGEHVRALTRRAERAAALRGAETVVGDLTAPETLDDAFKGVEGLHLISMSGDDYAPLRTAPQLMERAVDAGVCRVTVLTGADDELAVLEAVRGSDVEWTHLRPVEFMANKLEWAASIRSEGVVRAPFADQPHALVHEGDIAAVAVAALLTGEHAGRTYVPTGPATVTAREAAGILADVLQRPVRLIDQTADEARQQLLAAGITDDVAAYVLSYQADPPPEASTVLPTVETVIGQPPRTFAQWVAEHADVFTP